MFSPFGNGKPNDPLQFIRSYLAMAIQIGAPAFNQGDQRGCHEVYACTARLLVNGVKGADEVRQLLKEALEKCDTVYDINEKAWILRHTFDIVLGESETGEEA